MTAASDSMPSRTPSSTPTASAAGSAASGAVPLPPPPAFGSRSIADVLPSCAAALGAQGFPNPLAIPASSRICLVMVDGLGRNLLSKRTAHTPFLREKLSAGQGAIPETLDAAFPSTTAASLASLGTGVPPGQHGMVGYDVYAPHLDRVVNQLNGWDPDVDPQRWQPCPTIFERIHPDIHVATVSLPQFEGSPMTRAALRGGEFIGAVSLHARTTAAAEAMAAHPRMLAYFYLNELDKAGHQYGWTSAEWTVALEEVDSSLRRLDAQLPAGTLILVVGDHGMVDIAPSRRLDIGADPSLTEGVRHTAGEPRMVHLHVEPPRNGRGAGHPAEDDAAYDAAVAAVAARWRERLGNQTWILTRREAIDHGLFGPVVTESVHARIGDLIVAVHGDVALYDGRRVRPQAFEMVGQHGSWTKAERHVPLIAFRARGRVQGKRSGRG
ncbi:alkaline phosphatase family protein [Sinomonas sp. ASV486]|uniref:alkaline phosphatase family protein n=1 Tax=Sinomonas sp. ASV486 TaxID=3051170 RepID=UPI0027DD86AE|nr:alkaline phosphatase family protein [Sinomonas sp. ASV486]MDQ4489692.1 alkaline phosphatase family protein [Sinomonas sp. ASV486]